MAIEEYRQDIKQVTSLEKLKRKNSALKSFV